MRGEHIDNAILEALRHNPQTSKKSLAEKIGVNRSTCAEHIEKLVAQGLIKNIGYYPTDGEVRNVRAIILVKRPDNHQSNNAFTHLMNSSVFSSTYRSVSGSDYDYAVMTHYPLDSDVVLVFLDKVAELGGRTTTYAILGGAGGRAKPATRRVSKPD